MLRHILNPTGQRDHVARTEEGERFTKFANELIRVLQNPDAEVADDVAEMNARLRDLAEWTKRHNIKITPEMVQRELTVGGVQTTPVLQDFAVMYANDEYIGKRLLPSVPVSQGTGSVTYWIYDKKNRFSALSDEIGTRGKVNEVTENATPTSATLQPRALQEHVDARTKAAMDSPVAALINPLGIVMDGLELNQEKRVKNIITNPAQLRLEHRGTHGARSLGHRGWWRSGGGGGRGQGRALHGQRPLADGGVLLAPDLQHPEAAPDDPGPVQAHQLERAHASALGGVLRARRALGRERLGKHRQRGSGGILLAALAERLRRPPGSARAAAQGRDLRDHDRGAEAGVRVVRSGKWWLGWVLHQGRVRRFLDRRLLRLRLPHHQRDRHLRWRDRAARGARSAPLRPRNHRSLPRRPKHHPAAEERPRSATPRKPASSPSSRPKSGGSRRSGRRLPPSEPASTPSARSSSEHLSTRGSGSKPNGARQPE